MTDNVGRDFLSSFNTGQHFKCISAPIADNGHVISDENASIRAQSAQVDRKTIAVDTESAGAYIASFLNVLNTANENTKGLIIIRGISDFAAKKPGNDEWHVPASNNAVQILQELFEYL